MSESKPTKRRIYIVGGRSKNIPPWITAAFECEQFGQDHARRRTTDPDKTPDAVIVLSSWVGHKHYYNARDLAEKLKIPMLLSPGGWSASLKAAADLEVEWFIDDIEAAKSSTDLTEAQVSDLEEFIDNAWREAYNREWGAREALERRYSKDRKNFDRAQVDLEQMKEGEKARLEQMDAAARRVVAEVRVAAAHQREELKRHYEEVQARSERVARALTVHLSSLDELFDVVDAAQRSIIGTSASLRAARKMTRQKLDILNAALTIAEEDEDYGEGDVEPNEVEAEDTVASSNFQSDK